MDKKPAEYSIKRISTSVQIIANQLTQFQLNEEKNAEFSTGKRILVNEKLRIPLSKLAGVEGFAVLLSRSLVLAKTKIVWLSSLKVLADGTLEGFDAAAQNQDAASIELGRLAITEELLQLLFTFIGEPLMLVLLKDAWPNIKNLGSEKQL